METDNETLPALQRENQRLLEELGSARQIHQQHLEEIADIHRRLLPQPTKRIPGIRFSAKFRPFINTGGDYYDIVSLPKAAGISDAFSPPWGAIIADASGHGPAAAVEIAMLDAILRTYTGFHDGPAAVLNYVNRHFFTRQIRKDFITAFVANYDPVSRTLSYSNAGHLPGLLLAADGSSVKRLDAQTGIPLGVKPDNAWCDAETQVASGDILILLTDGLVEARSPTGEQYGLSRIESRLRGKWEDTDQVLNKVYRELDGFRAGKPQSDDESLIVIKID